MDGKLRSLGREKGEKRKSGENFSREVEEPKFDSGNSKHYTLGQSARDKEERGCGLGKETGKKILVAARENSLWRRQRNGCEGLKNLNRSGRRGDKKSKRKNFGYGRFLIVLVTSARLSHKPHRGGKVEKQKEKKGRIDESEMRPCPWAIISHKRSR